MARRPGKKQQFDTSMKHHHHKQHNQPVFSIHKQNVFCPYAMQTLEILFSRNVRPLLVMNSESLLLHLFLKGERLIDQ